MFKKILWATDGSDAADTSLPVVKQLALAEGAEVTVFHGVVTAVGPHGGYPMYFDDDARADKIRAQVEDLEAAGITAELHVFTSDGLRGPAHDISEAVRREGADLVIVGTRGHTRLGGFLLGSVTQRLLTLSPVPILAVPSVVSAVEDDESSAAATAA